MKRAVLPSLLILGLVAACLPVSAEEVLPRPASGDRYVKMANRSPFAPPTIAPAVERVAPVAAGPKWSDQLAVTLLTQRGGVYYATIYDKSKSEHFLLQSDREDIDRQLALTSVQWGEVTDQTTVMLRHNGDFATVRFDPGAAGAAPAANVPIPGRGLGVAQYPGQPGGQPRLNPPLPPNPNTLVQRRIAPIRTNPTVTQPTIHPPPNVQRRPVNNKDDDDDE